MNLEPASGLMGNAGVYVKQEYEELEDAVGWEEANSYRVISPRGLTLFHAQERSEGFWAGLLRNFMRSRRPFHTELVDAEGIVKYRFVRPLSFLMSRLEIKDSRDRPIGLVRQQFSLTKRRFTISGRGLAGLRIEGPMFLAQMFTIFRGNQEVGRIVREAQNTDWARTEDADTFGVTFGSDLDETARAVCLGATFLIDFVYFEDNTSRLARRRRRGGLLSGGE